MGVIVQKDNQSNRYYLHEVITENIVKKDSTSSLDGTSALTGDLDTVLNVESSIDNISQTSKDSTV